MLLARLNPQLAGYKPADVGVLYRKLYDRLSALPVSGRGAASYSPLSGSTSRNDADQGYTPKPGESVELETVFVGPSYPAALGIPLLRGRAIELRDGVRTPLVAMVNEAFERRYVAGASAIGHRFTFDPPEAGHGIEIVGVLKDACFHDAKDAVTPIAFLALLQDTSQSRCRPRSPHGRRARRPRSAMRCVRRWPTWTAACR